MNKPNKAFWVISVLAFLWNIMGVNAYLQQEFQTDSFKAMYTSEQLSLIVNAPAWSTAAFAIAVFGGLLGSIGLLLRKKWAHPVFLISLVGVLVQMFYNFFIIDSIAVYGPGALIMPVMIIVVGFLLIWYSKYSFKKGWLC